MVRRKNTPAADTHVDPEATPTQARTTRSESSSRYRADSEDKDGTVKHPPKKTLNRKGNFVFERREPSDWSVIDSLSSPTQPMKIFDILRLTLPSHPPLFSFSGDGTVSGSTRGPSKTEVAWRKERLEYIVPFHPLVDQLFPFVHTLLRDREVAPNDPWITSVHPYYTTRQLPSVISTEHDSEDYAWNVLVRPSVSVIQSLSELRPWTSKQNFPNIRSCGGPAHIPDGILLGKDREDIRQVYEVKTEAVMSSPALEECLTALTARWANMPLGRAVKFNWPTSGNPSKETRLFVQVWCQMLDKNVAYAMLTSYSRSYFFIRHPDHPKKLFISHEYQLESSPTLLATVGFTALALGQIQLGDIYFPLVDTEWNGPNEWTEAGPDSSMFPTTYRAETVVRDASLAWVDSYIPSSKDSKGKGR